jgi:hypothetical protein
MEQILTILVVDSGHFAVEGYSALRCHPTERLTREVPTSFRLTYRLSYNACMHTTGTYLRF